MLRPWVDRLSSDCSSVSNCAEFRARMATVCDRLSSAVALALLVGASDALRLFEAVDGLGDLVGVLGVAGGHRAQVRQERLERRLLPAEALAAGGNDLLQLRRRDGAEDLATPPARIARRRARSRCAR